MRVACLKFMASLTQRLWYGTHPLRYLLLPLSWLTALVLGVRRLWLRFAKPAPVSVPVIVVGNLTVGGSGKTPLVAAIAHHLKRAGYRPGIVSRGYGAECGGYPYQVQTDDTADKVGDEPLLLRRKTSCPVVIDPARRRGLAYLIEHSDVNVVLSDDGLQHYRLHRDLEIVVIDGQRRFGNGLLLPAGPLREAVSRLDTVDLVVVNGGDGALAPGQFSMRMKPLGFENLESGERLACDAFAGRRVHACAGIAHPQRFFDTLVTLGMTVQAHAYPDHHRYVAGDLCFERATPVIITEKDAVKCRYLATPEVWALQTEAVLEEAFWKKLDMCLLQFK